MYEMYLKFFESFTATVKFHDKTIATWSDSSKDRRQIERQTVSIILIFSLHRCLNSASFQPRKVNFTQKFFAISFFFQISDQNIQSASRWFTYDAANHRKRKWQNKEKPPVWKRFTVDDIFCLWDIQKRRYRTLHWESQCLPPYSQQVFFTGEFTKRWVVRRIPSRLHFICTDIKV